MASCNHRYERLNDHQVFCKRCGDIKGYYYSGWHYPYWHWRPAPYWGPYWFSNTSPTVTIGSSTSGTGGSWDWTGTTTYTALNTGGSSAEGQ